MREFPRIPAGVLDLAAGGGSSRDAQQRIALDSRRPLLLNHHGYVLQVAAGHVDLFAVPSTETAGARRHLFRVETGELIVDLPEDSDQTTESIQVIAVGSLGAEAQILPRNQFDKFDALAAWIEQLAKLAAGQQVDWSAREAKPGEQCELMPGEHCRAAGRGVVWAAVERGDARLMGEQPAYGDTLPPVPLASGMWIEAGEGGCTLACSAAVPGRADLWNALDQFHRCAVACIRRRLVANSATEAHGLDRRADLNGRLSHDLLEDLSNVIVQRSGSDRTDADVVDPLFASCQVVAHAIHAAAVRPHKRSADDNEFEDIAEIARASRLRVRRILLRGDWWKSDVGALVAWHGEERKPVALIPGKRYRYLMIEPQSGRRSIVDATLAMELSPEAAMLYPALPARALSFWDLLTFGARHSRGNALRIVLGALALGALSLATPLLVQLLVNSIIPRTELDELALCAAALGLAAIGMAALQAMQGIAMLRLEGVVDWKLQAALVDRLLRLPASLFRQYTVGDLADRALGIDAIRRIVTGRVLRGFMAGAFLFFSFLLLFYYDLSLAVIAAGLTTLRALIIIASSGVRLYHENRHFNLQGKVEGFVIQLLAGIGKLRVADATIRALAVWARQFAAQKRHFVASQRAANLLEVSEAAFPTLATLVIFAVAQGSDSSLIRNLGAFLAFFAAFGQALGAVGELARAISNSLIAIPHLSRLRPLIAAEAEVSEDRKPAGDLSGAIDISRVTFRYVPGGPTILENLTLRISQGEYVALVGPSGGGKSTIFRLLLGFEKPEAGAVFYDGRAIETLDVGTVRRQMGVVLQNGKLASGSIYDNICGGIPLPMDQAWEAARLAGLEADIQAMPMGMHTVLAEGVSTLSGGQRQRLMIARAVARRPRILLLDEATSALDNQAQTIVSTSLGRLNVTRIVIAHRLSTVIEADRIVVLVDGKVVQTGTFAELSGAPGVFADFARRQLL